MFNLTFRRQVFFGFAVSIILVFIVGGFSYKSINQLESDNNWVIHSHQVIESSDQLLQNLIDAETGTRGFVASGNEVFLDPYHAALPKINDHLNTLRQLTKDNYRQQQVIDSIITYTSIQLGLLKENITVRKASGLDYILKQNMLAAGKNNMDRIRAKVKLLQDNEYKLLSDRKKRTSTASTTTIITIITGCIIFLIIILLLFSYIQKTFNEQKQTELIITSTNNELQKVLAENEDQNWLLTGTGELSQKIQGQQSESEIAQNVLDEICNYSGAKSGTIYLYNELNKVLELSAHYAFHDFNALKSKIRLGEGWIGQAAKSQTTAVIKNRLNEGQVIQTSTANQILEEIYVIPFFFDKQLKGVIELAFQEEPIENVKNYLTRVAIGVGIAVNTAQSRTILQKLFAETQQQAEELEAQQEEMRVTNEELLTKTEMLQASEEELRVQQEELRAINTELEEKASLLEEKNQDIEQARLAIDEKVKELEISGKYKSEFLANMSHELRTPLNSILVLARILKENKASNLSNDQLKYANVIFNAGNDLLTLINDILDLSKIESGKLEILNENIRITEITESMESLFAEVAINKKVNFSTNIKDVPEYIFTDKVRVEQVLKNLLSNAFKFTNEGGGIAINVSCDANNISFSVKDTGIGIPYDKQKVIFEAFQQADGSTSRKYGGTGLGLSISRELALLLGGKLSLKSDPGIGSEFTLTIPIQAENTESVQPEKPSVIALSKEVSYRPKLQPVIETNKEATVVIVEDDPDFADILKTYAEDHSYQAILVSDGVKAVDIIAKTNPDAVILDIMLPGKDGWQILKELKHNSLTMHIPVHMMSGADVSANRVQNEGAISFIKKPVDTEILDHLFNDMLQYGAGFKQVLLVEDHEDQSQALKQLMQEQGITVDQAFNGEEAFQMLTEHDYQCVILDLNLPDISGLDLLDKIKSLDRFKSLTVIINTAMELDKASVNRLLNYTDAMVIKTAKSADRLIDEVNLFLHKISSTSNISAERYSKTKAKVSSNEFLKGKKVLIVDDDMRNIFALSSAMQSYNLEVEIANDGEEAIEKLKSVNGIDIVLMDIMMPKMDGYESMQLIRKMDSFSKLPIIALTAKAMKDDREKCLAAGANDYITKPVDIDRLLSLMQFWLDK